MAARTWPAGEAGPLGAQAGHCLCSKQGQPVTVGEGGRGPWVRHFQLISHSHSGCVLPTWELGAGSQVLGPRHWAGHRCGIILSPFPVSHFRLFLNKGLSSLKEHLLTWAGPHLQPGSTGTWPSGVEGRGGPCYLAAGSVAPEGWTPRLLPQGGAEVQPTSSEHSGPPQGGRLRSPLSHYRVPDHRAQADPGPGAHRGHLHKAVLDAQWPLL